MWVVVQERNHILKATNFWLSNDGTKIYAGYGATADDELWDTLGEYERNRGIEIFEEIINALGSVDKYEMPKE